MSAASRFLAAAFLPSCLALPSAWAAEADPVQAAANPTGSFRPLVPDDRPVEPLLAPASNEGQARIQQFKLAPGLQVDLWAAEPLLANPVAFSVDEQGRIFTSETYRYRTSVLDIRHYMFMLEDDLALRSIEDRLEKIRKWFGPDGEQRLSRETEVIRLLEDRDSDGRADVSSVFAENFRSPLSGIGSGVLAWRSNVWFTEIPSVWRFSPAGSGTSSSTSPAPESGSAPSPLASVPRVMDGFQAVELLRGFGVRFSFTGHDLHGLKFGPDGRLYFSVGDRGARIVTREGNVIDLPDEGAVFRCEPDGTQLEVVHRGLRNPQELAFNEYGDLFTGDNDSDQGDRERWVQVIEGADSGWRVGHQHAPLGNAGMWNMERLWVPHFAGQAAYILPPIANIGDGPSGLVYDYGTSLPEPWKNRFLLAYFKGTSAQSGIYSLKVQPVGAGYELVAHDEFVWNSLVPDVDLGPDGSIFFADWHEGWPKSNKGRLYRAYFPGVMADPVVKETAKLLADGFAQRDENELLGLLAHRDMRVRQEAQFELAARGPKSFAGLKKVAFESKNQLARIHAIWGVGQIVRKAPANMSADELFEFTRLWLDPDQEVLGQALLTLGDAKVGQMFGPLPQQMHLFNERQIRQALVGLGRVWKDGSGSRWWSKTVAGEVWDRLPAHLQDSARDFSNKLGVALWEKGPPLPDWPGLTYLETNSTPSPVLVTAVVHSGLRAVVGFQEFIQRRDHPSRAVRQAIILALRRNDGELSEMPKVGANTANTLSITYYLTDPDPTLCLEAARAINDVPIRSALPALAELAEPTKLDALRAKFAALGGQASSLPGPAGFQPAGLSPSTRQDARSAGPAKMPALRDVRASQPLPWGDTPIDHLTPMLLRVVNANFRVGTPEAARRLASLAQNRDLPELIRTEALFALGTWAAPAARDRIVGVFRPLPAREPEPAREALAPVFPTLAATDRPREAILVAAAEAVARLDLTPSIPILAELVRNESPATGGTSVPGPARAAALRALAQIETRRPELERLLAFAAQDASEVLRLAASKLNAQLNPNDAAGQLAAQLESGSLAEQQSAYASLGDLDSTAADALLAEALDKLMKREIANEVMLDLVEAAAKRQATAVKDRLATYQNWKLPKDHLSPYREALFGGDADRGRKIFYENAAVACTRCHQIGSDGGGNAGPKLDGLASRVTREHLLESIVFPNQQIVEGFETAILTLKDGQTYAGVVKTEDETGLVILSPEEGDITLRKTDIDSRDTGLSGMPEGMGELLTRQDLRDLIEFLGTLK